MIWHHNLFAHNYSRNPRFQGAVDADFRKNVICDWGQKSAYREGDRLDYAGNYLKPGPSSIQHPPLFHDGKAAPASLFLHGNVIEGDAKSSSTTGNAPDSNFERDRVAAEHAFPAPPVSTESAQAAFTDVLATPGATKPSRDAIDRRVIEDVRSGRGRIISRPGKLMSASDGL